jgi:hypothetical protein
MAIFLALGVALTACVEQDTNSPDTGERREYRQTAWVLPTSSTEAFQNGLDLDGEVGRDNRLGMVLSYMVEFGTDLQAMSDGAFSGGLVIEHELTADGLDLDEAASWRVGGGAPIIGHLEDGEFETDVAGEAVVTLVVGSAVEVALRGARIEATVDEERCAGVLAGAIDETALRRDVLPAIAALVYVDLIADPQSEYWIIFEESDLDGDGVVTVGEILADQVFQNIFRLDLDLDRDGAPDALSIGLAFECTG